MRRPVLYLAGMFLATGASLALAGPASAAPDGGKWCPKHHASHLYDYEYESESNVLVNQGIFSQKTTTQYGLIPINIGVL